MWKITLSINEDLDSLIPSKVVQSVNYREEADFKLCHRFRLLDDDGLVCAEGLANSCDDQTAFDPLDDYGEGMWGCTTIEYFVEGVWRRL
jgi:hypothetical protein